VVGTAVGVRVGVGRRGRSSKNGGTSREKKRQRTYLGNEIERPGGGGKWRKRVKREGAIEEKGPRKNKKEEGRARQGRQGGDCRSRIKMLANWMTGF